MNTIVKPRQYWSGLSDAQLIRERDEVMLKMPEDTEFIADVNDDLERRKQYRRRVAAQGYDPAN